MKKSVIVFLSLFLFVSAPFHANANIITTTGKYIINAIKHVPGGAKVNATNTATGAKHAIKHGVSAPALGAAIGGGLVGMAVGNGVGLAFQAITGLALDAVDWVMDPANNQVKYAPKGTSGIKYMAEGQGYYFDTPKEACDAYWVRNGGKQESFCKGINQFGFPVTINIIPVPPEPIDWKTLSLDTLAKKVIEQADGGNVDSQKTIEDYVTHLAKEGELDNELDNATDITKPDEPTKPEDPDKDCPIGTTKEGDVCIKPAPDNAPLFCNQSDFTRKVCDWIDWTQVKHDVPEPDAGKVDVIDKSKDLNIDKNRIDFSNQCPAPTPINSSVGGFPVSTELSYQPLCDFFTMLNPFVIGMGGISSALIIAAGVRRG